MSDIEISKALALAIGWREDRIGKDGLPDPDIQVSWGAFHGRKMECWDARINVWRTFDYRDWNVIGPIAATFDCFPYMNTEGNWFVRYHKFAAICKTPQEAIAQAVIGAMKLPVKEQQP